MSLAAALPGVFAQAISRIGAIEDESMQVKSQKRLSDRS
jgi:hypothetical protein